MENNNPTDRNKKKRKTFWSEFGNVFDRVGNRHRLSVIGDMNESTEGEKDIAGETENETGKKRMRLC